MFINNVNIGMDSYILYIMYMEGYGMKTTEMIEILEHYLEVFGDCELMRLDNNGMIDPIEEVEFIGDNQILLMSDQFYDRSTYKLYQSSQKLINEKRKKEWSSDCDGEKP